MAKKRIGRRVFEDRAPMPIAREFFRRRWRVSGHRTLWCHRDTFYRWADTHYRPYEENGLRKDLWRFLSESDLLKNGLKEPFNPKASDVNGVLSAVKALAHLDGEKDAPCWIRDRAGRLPAENYLACKNRLLNVNTFKVRSHTPELFNLNALPYAYKKNPRHPKQWHRFLRELWPNDAGCRRALQEIFGYCLSADTAQQKIFLLVGPKRSGKGTIARVLTGMLGSENVANPTMSSLNKNFGLEPLIGKQLAIISDARMGRSVDKQTAVERLLSISGEDALQVDRKYKAAWTGKFNARILIMTNELPDLGDASGALASRFIVMTMQNSFYGKEDPGLTRKLLKELPGIIVWSLEGLKRLRGRGHFLQPQSSEDAIRHLEEMSSPVAAFVRERCERGPGKRVPVKTLYNDWRYWCHRDGRHAGTAQTFGRDLRAAIPGIKRRQGTQGENFYDGLGLRGLTFDQKLARWKFARSRRR